MALELLLLCALIFIFIVSFCGLLQKIRQSYERERVIADRIARRQQVERNSTESDVYVNSAYIPGDRTDSGVFPTAPPPYSRNYVDPPPKYEDVIKIEDTEPTPPERISSNAIDIPEVHSTPPPYTISR